MLMIFLIYESPAAPIPSEVSLPSLHNDVGDTEHLYHTIVYCAIKFGLHQTTGLLSVRHLRVANVLRWEILHKD
jgi:hypothetical protein